MSRRSEKAYQAPKIRAVERESPPPPLFLKKGEGERHVLLAAGPAASFGKFSWNWEFQELVRELFCLLVRIKKVRSRKRHKIVFTRCPVLYGIEHTWYNIIQLCIETFPMWYNTES